MAGDAGEHQRQWRYYRTESGARPVRDYLDSLPTENRTAILAAMEEVRHQGLQAARHLRSEIWEVRASHDTNAYRVLFAPVGRFSQVLLSLESFPKKTPRTPSQKIDVAEQRLADWRRQGTEIAGKRREQQ